MDEKDIKKEMEIIETSNLMYEKRKQEYLDARGGDLGIG